MTFFNSGTLKFVHGVAFLLGSIVRITDKDIRKTHLCCDCALQTGGSTLYGDKLCHCDSTGLRGRRGSTRGCRLAGYLSGYTKEHIERQMQWHGQTDGSALIVCQ